MQGNFYNLLSTTINTYLKPVKELDISSWANEHVFLPPGTSAKPGRWKTIPYQQGVFDAIEDPKVNKISLEWGAQLGKTALLNNTIGYYIEHKPESQIMMQPSESDLKTWLETKFNPMVDYSKSVQEKLAKPRGRDGVNNQKMKKYKGGFLMFAWAGSPNTQRGRSAPKIYCDEVDGYERSHEGHPVNLVWQRAATFGRKRKLILTSTPTIKGNSFIEDSFNAGDRRRYYVPCPHCGHHQVLKWQQVQWQKDEKGVHLPHTALYFCENCGAGINDGEKIAMLRKGQWRAEMPFTGHASFHLSELYSPFRKFGDIVESFLEKKATRDLKSFVNVSLAETWEEEGEHVDPESLEARVEDLEVLPDNCFFLTAGIDVQIDRIEVQTIGWGVGEESHVLDYHFIYGDTDKPIVWLKLNEYLDTKTFIHVSGRPLRIEYAGLDTGGSGNMTSRAYEYVRSRLYGRPLAFKGKGGAGVPLYTKPTLKQEKGKKRMFLYTIGVDEAKNVIYNRLQNDEAGPGKIHFNKKVCDKTYFKQLTAEKRMIKYEKGFPKFEWHNVAPDKRNEALDTFVYALATLRIAVGSGVDLDRIYVQNFKKKGKKNESNNK
ncbi:phage terminase large subunit family protein [Francisella philomiragia]|uniref:Phage terminase large subunit family protein n=1 Tax=Francisella philomiragia TaxID=28110 RepID=A0ABS1GCY3_9GAMM|nr:phage terminase large subunit family protein [Francisella philomiragia]MBK2259000.1 phage terminase large subunit family protein [Francisella philomiragia]MBK2302691.1 phage terminase large subunit family protein [Francisella philomiragia]